MIGESNVNDINAD